MSQKGGHYKSSLIEIACPKAISTRIPYESAGSSIAQSESKSYHIAKQGVKMQPFHQPDPWIPC